MIQTATRTAESPAPLPGLAAPAAASGSSRRRTASGGGSSATSTTAPSSGAGLAGVAAGRIGRRLDPESELGRLLAARAELADSLQELREIARGLHPAVLVDHGLGAARSRARRCPSSWTAQLDERRLPAPVELAAYYMVSEALTNVAKHAHATGVTVTAARVGDRLIVEVQETTARAERACALADPRAARALAPRRRRRRKAAREGASSVAARVRAPHSAAARAAPPPRAASASNAKEPHASFHRSPDHPPGMAEAKRLAARGSAPDCPSWRASSPSGGIGAA